MMKELSKLPTTTFTTATTITPIQVAAIEKMLALHTSLFLMKMNAALVEINHSSIMQMNTNHLKMKINHLTLLTTFKSTFGNDKRFTVNSIIVKPGDTACKATQDSGAKSHFGTKYAELSNLTGGGIGSICDSDYSTNLNLFVDKIIGSLSSVPLECTPVGDVTLTITPTMNGLTTTVQNSSLVFNKQIPIGSTVDIKYKCNDSRSPSSISGSKPQILEQGFFARIINFFKNLF